MSFATCVILPPLTAMLPVTVKFVNVAPATSGYSVPIVTVPVYSAFWVHEATVDEGPFRVAPSHSQLALEMSPSKRMLSVEFGTRPSDQFEEADAWPSAAATQVLYPAGDTRFLIVKSTVAGDGTA